MRADVEYSSIPAMMRANGERFAARVAVIEGDRTYTFAEIGAEMRVVAKSLVALGVEPGDRVAVWAPNSATWMTAALGALAAGAWLVPINTRYKAGEAAFILRSADTRALFVANGFLGVDYVDALTQEDPGLRALGQTVCLSGPPSLRASAWNEFLTLGSDVDDAEIDGRIDALGPDSISDILYTSGTTGRPKGVLLRHGAGMRAFYEGYNRAFELQEGDVALGINPFFHCFGYKGGWMLGLMVGASIIPLSVFTPEETLGLIEKHHVTHIGGAPTFFLSILNHPDRERYDLTSIRKAMVGAAYVPAELCARMHDELGADSIATGYGLTEAHAVVSMSMPGDEPSFTAEWSGRLIPGVEARIVDDHGADVALGERGELWVRGYNLMSGYYEDPAATATVIDADGWLHTGDIAYMNADRYVKIADRKKDMYIAGGFNVAPAEVEGILQEWDRIGQAAVIGIPDDRLGEVGMAFVVPRPGVLLTASEVIEYARLKMANFKVPRVVEIVDAIPMNATGKVLKTELRARVNQG